MKYFRSAVPFLFGALSILEGTAYGVPVPSALFGNHAVLQRSISVPIWGSAEPGETMTVTFGAISATTTTDESGHWRVQLPAMEGGQIQYRISFVYGRFRPGGNGRSPVAKHPSV